MATATTIPPQAAPVAPYAAAPPALASTSNQRIASLRTVMMVLISASVSLGLLVGLVAWQASASTYDDYRTIVDEGSVSVDAALRARAAVLDHMAASATYLQSSGGAQDQALDRARQAWDTFNNEARISWRNVTDRTYGESQVYTAADRSASDYIQQIGAMYSYASRGESNNAREAFLTAREVLNTRLLPALGGLEAVKVEAMEATYEGAATRIERWRTALTWVTIFFLAALAGGLLVIRRMHYRWSWPVGLSLLVSAALMLVMQWQLERASSDAEVMVRRAYDNVAGAQGVGALLSQGRALESIAIFDLEGASRHLESFDQYITLVDERLCGPRDCGRIPFTQGDVDTIATGVKDAALDEQSKLGVPRPPLVANVHFEGQARGLEALRADYVRWLDSHIELQGRIAAEDLGAASALSTGESALAFEGLVSKVEALTSGSRAEFDRIWRRVYLVTGLFQFGALIFPAAGLIGALGIWRRRSELFV